VGSLASDNKRFRPSGLFFNTPSPNRQMLSVGEGATAPLDDMPGTKTGVILLRLIFSTRFSPVQTRCPSWPPLRDHVCSHPSPDDSDTSGALAEHQRRTGR
jgi:hypothetical protein